MAVKFRYCQRAVQYQSVYSVSQITQPTSCSRYKLIFYNNGDYRFKNNTDQAFQLLIWCENEQLCAELRSERPIEYAYRLVEEGHHFQKEGEKYYRVSKIYKETLDKETQKPIYRELVLDNHSEVMYDYELIPKEIL